MTGWALTRAAEPEEPACLHTRGFTRAQAAATYTKNLFLLAVG